MKMFGSFAAGALAGFLLGSTKQGCAVREGLDLFVGRFFCANGEGPEEPLMEKATDKAQPALKSIVKAVKVFPKAGSEADSSEDEQIVEDHRPLDIDKAHELAEKLGAKVNHAEGEESLPHSHPIETSTSRLTAYAPG